MRLDQPTLNTVLREVYWPAIHDRVPGHADLDVDYHPDRGEYSVILWTWFMDGTAYYARLPIEPTLVYSIQRAPRSALNHLASMVEDLAVILHFAIVHNRGGYC